MWQLSVAVASAEVRRAALRAGDAEVRRLLPGAADERGCDQYLIAALRANTGEPAVEVVHYDVTVDRWTRGPLRTIGPWNRLDRVVFECVSDAVTPLALVKTVAQDRVVLQLRGGLLPVRNPRRPLASVGSVFHVAAHGALPDGYLVVDRVDGHLLECHCVGQCASLLSPHAAERCVGAGVRWPHAATHFTFTLAGSSGALPLAGCQIFASNAREMPGIYLGRTDDQGQIEVSAAHGVRWVQVKLDAVMLEEFPLVPGWYARQTIPTQIDPALLATAAAVRDGHSELAELTAVRQAYLAQLQVAQAHRSRGGSRVAARGRSESDRRAHRAVTSAAQRPPAALELLFPDQSSSAQTLWESLSQALNQLPGLVQ